MKKKIWDALRDLAPIEQSTKREKHPWSSVLFSKVTGIANSNAPPWVLFTFFRLYKWYQIAQRITFTTRKKNLPILNPYLPNANILYTLNTPKNPAFFGVFSGYIIPTIAKDGSLESGLINNSTYKVYHTCQHLWTLWLLLFCYQRLTWQNRHLYPWNVQEGSWYILLFKKN